MRGATKVCLELPTKLIGKIIYLTDRKDGWGVAVCVEACLRPG